MTAPPPYRSAPLVPPQAPPRSYKAIVSLACALGIGWFTLQCAPVIFLWSGLVLLGVGGVWLLAELAHALAARDARRLLARAGVGVAVGLILVPCWSFWIDRSIESEVRALRLGARRFHAAHGQWPKGFDELPEGRRMLHRCPSRRSLNCLEWWSPSRDGGAPYLVRAVYPGFARIVYYLDRDQERFIG